MLTVSLLGCGGITEALEGLNDAPSINFLVTEDGSTVLYDSIKVSLKTGQEFYDFEVSVYDVNENLSRVYYEKVSGLGEMYKDGNLLPTNNIGFEDNTIKFSYRPDNAGLHEIRLRVEDTFGQSNGATIQLVAFENLPPVANLRVQKLAQKDEFEYRLRADESFDRDSKYGGQIALYEFTINDVIYEMVANEKKHIFPESDVYEIFLRVKDNDGVWSERVGGSFTVR